MEHLPFPEPARPQRRPGSGRRSVWGVFGTVLAVLLVMAGLAVLGGLVLTIVAINNFGSNK